MRKYALLLALMIVTIFTFAACGRHSGSLIEQQATAQTTTQPEALRWILPPSLSYEFIFQCNCGRFFNQDWAEIDPATGQLTNEYHNGHGGSQPAWVYDIEHGLFGNAGYEFGLQTFIGLHPLDNFEESISSDFCYWGNTRISYLTSRLRGVTIIANDFRISDCTWS